MTTADPRWDEPDNAAGTMIRGALWLVQVVGEGNTFTKNQLREAFPGVAQIDRRIRDLRDYGWVVHSNAEDVLLSAEDQRFVARGVPVWDAKARRAAAPQKAVSSRERLAVLRRDGYMCTLCGVAGGEVYPEDNLRTAVVGVSRRTLVYLSGKEVTVLVTECKRCRAGRPSERISLEEVITAVRHLDSGERRRILRWMERGRRGATDLDRAWTSFLRVPTDRRSEVIDEVTGIR